MQISRENMKRLFRWPQSDKTYNKAMVLLTLTLFQIPTLTLTLILALTLT
jgi:hypothetical protein